MSHEDSLDDETKRLLAEADSDDSIESNKDSQEKPSVKDKESKNNTEIDISDDMDLDDSNW